MWTVPIPLVAIVGAFVGLSLGDPGHFVIPMLMTLFLLPLPLLVGWRVWTVGQDLAAGKAAVLEVPIASLLHRIAVDPIRTRDWPVRLLTTLRCYGVRWDRGWRALHRRVDTRILSVQSGLSMAAEPLDK
jgi:hypothetical protein